MDVYNDIAFHAQAIASGAWPADRFYCESIMLNTRDMGVVLTAKLDSLLDLVDVLESNGWVEWETIGEKLSAFESWSSLTNAPYSQWNCDSDIVTAMRDEAAGGTSVTSVDGDLLVRCAGGSCEARIMDTLGRSLWRGLVRDGGRIDATAWPFGVLLVELTQSQRRQLHRIVVQ